MNESTLTRLKTIVERAVRPVRASSSRKRKMREELLAHVVSVFEEEARLGDEQAALARTQERFGQPAELAGQLQASVPRIDGVNRLAEDLFGSVSGEPALRVAAGLAALAGASGIVLLGIAIPIQVLRGQGDEWLTVTRVPSLLAPLWAAFMVFCGTLLTLAMRQALLGPAGRSWPRALLVAAAAWLIVPVTTFAFCLAVMADIQRSLWDVVPLLLQGVLAPVVLVGAVYLVGPQRRHDREWESLQID
jgi:hypothetical protein